MENNLKKITIISLLLATLYSSEIEYGHGSMELKGGFLGLSGSISEDVDTVSFLQNHSNIASSNWFYAYNLTYYSSKHLKEAQKFYNINRAQFISWLPGGSTASVFIPAMDYSIKGLDLGLSLGYDLIHKNENNYLGLAGYVGINAPTIESKKDDKQNLPLSIDKNKLSKYFLPSKTNITTYKIGLGLYGRVSLAPTLSLYTNSILAYQRADVDNSYAKANFNANGLYKALDLGLRFSPIEKDFKVLGLTLSPRLYLTTGFKLEQWDVKDFGVDVSGMGINYSPSKMQITSKAAYMGLGYSW